MLLQQQDKNKMSPIYISKKQNIFLIKLPQIKQKNLKINKEKRAKTELQQIKQLKNMGRHVQKLLSTNLSTSICHSYRVKTEKDKNNHNLLQRYLRNSKQYLSLNFQSGKLSLGNIKNNQVTDYKNKQQGSMLKIEKEIVQKNILKKQFIELKYSKQQKNYKSRIQQKIKQKSKEKGLLKLSNIQDIMNKLDTKKQNSVINEDNCSYKLNQIRRIKIKPPVYKPKLQIFNKKLQKITKTIQPQKTPKTIQPQKQPQKNQKQENNHIPDLSISIKGWTKQNKSQNISSSQKQSNNDFQNY